MANRGYRSWLTYTWLILIVIFIVLPVYFMVVVSIKQTKDIYRGAPLVPTGVTLSNYTGLFASGFGVNLVNSLIVAVGTSVVSIVVGILAAYAITRIRFPGRGTTNKLLLASYLVPLVLLFVPLAVIAANLHLGNSLLGIAIIYLAFTVPLATWFLLGFFRGVNIEVEEAAWLDGAGLFRTLRYVVLPVSAPGVVTAGVLTFTLSWGELFLALVFLTSSGTQTAPVALQYLIQGDVQNYGPVMAGAVVSTIPVAVIYYLCQRWLVEGIGAGATKG